MNVKSLATLAGTDLKSLGGLLAESYTNFSNDKGSRMAAALSYYTVFSIAPLLIITIAIAALVLGHEGATYQISTQLKSLLGPSGATAVQTMVESANRPATGKFAVVVGFVILLFGASGVFGELQDSLNTIWKVPPAKTGGLWLTIKNRFISFSMVLGIGFLLLVSLILSAALAAVGNIIHDVLPYQIVGEILNFIVSIAMISLLFGMIFKVLPDLPIAWRDVGLGAVVTAFLFTIGKFALGLYLGRSAVTSSYGAAGALAVVLLWSYYSSMILLFGAEFTAVYSRHRLGASHVPVSSPTPS